MGFAALLVAVKKNVFDRDVLDGILRDTQTNMEDIAGNPADGIHASAVDILMESLQKGFGR